ncbi:MAG: S8 family serine peptidase [Bacteroidota bacterium]|nr:S8 family serine peptidase [Bacteroidota bacterium]
MLLQFWFFLALRMQFWHNNMTLREKFSVYFKSGIQRATLGQLKAINASPALTSLLSNFRIDSNGIKSTFPNFNESDTVKVLPNRDTLKLMDMARIFSITVPVSKSVGSVIASLQKLPDVLFAQRNMNARLLTAPTDPDYANQWFLNNTGQSGGTSGADIKAEAAWSIFTVSSSMTIAIVDAGVETGREDLFGKATGDVDDGEYHGTHVAGIAAAKADNGFGGVGVDWNARILSEQIFSTTDISINNPDGYRGDANTYNKIVNAVNSGAEAINNSWCGPIYSVTIREALAYAY